MTVNGKGNIVDVTHSKKRLHEEGEELDSEDEEEDIDLEKDDDDDGDSTVIHKYAVDMIAACKDTNEELMLHWGIGRKNAADWTGPDDKFLPKDSKRWPDGKAVQTKFIKRE